MSKLIVNLPTMIFSFCLSCALFLLLHLSPFLSFIPSLLTFFSVNTFFLSFLLNLFFWFHLPFSVNSVIFLFLSIMLLYLSLFYNQILIWLVKRDDYWFFSIVFIFSIPFLTSSVPSARLLKALSQQVVFDSSYVLKM